ncbi:MAG: orotidine-5'-phosphate decarboxylase [Flavobacteriaceae bacterium]
MTRKAIDPKKRLIVALDLSTVDEARRAVDALGDAVSFYKVGMQLVFAGGLDFVRELRQAGHDVFLDMKLLDIANTVEKGIASIAGLGVQFTTIHAYPQAMEAAVRGRGADGLKVLGVTVLTSLDDDDLEQAGFSESVEALVRRRAVQARKAGLDGLVCSPLEAEKLRRLIGDDMALVTPGVRPAGSDSGDQKRVATPASTIRAGSDYLVVGRPVLEAGAPRDAARRIVDEIAGAL